MCNSQCFTYTNNNTIHEWKLNHQHNWGGANNLENTFNFGGKLWKITWTHKVAINNFKNVKMSIEICLVGSTGTVCLQYRLFKAMV